MRKTKIICTIGPASESEDVLTRMCMAGMDVARLNFSHGTHAEHDQKITAIKNVREKLSIPLAIMLDTKGPEYRIGTFQNHSETLNDGDHFVFTTEDVEGSRERVSVSCKTLPQILKAGDRILVNDGLLIFEAEEILGPEIRCRVITGGQISDRKSMHFPNHVIEGEYLSDRDKEDLLFGISRDVDYVAASFVSCKKDMEELRTFLDENGGSDIDIIAKIENRSGVDNIDEICEIADGIMVARGDLGVEIPFMEVPAIQKQLISKCRMLGKRVITATEMLESMIRKPRPTRAEISDVANAVYDGSSAIMLSGETASGKYPVEAVQSMAEIALYTEQQIDYKAYFRSASFTIRSNLDAVSYAACSMAVETDAMAIIVSSLTGMTARMVSRFRCPVDIIGRTSSERAYRKLNLSWGVTPVLSEEILSMDVMFYHAVQETKELLHLRKGDRVVLTGGPVGGRSGNTNTIRLETV